MKLIDEDALVAKIERKLGELSKLEKASYEIGLYDAYKIVLSSLNTLEVKEVDLEKDVDKILEENDWNYDEIDFYDFAKHFFELGLKAQKGE